LAGNNAENPCSSDRISRQLKVAVQANKKLMINKADSFFIELGIR
jgi:hypothetical protein